MYYLSYQYRCTVLLLFSLLIMPIEYSHANGKKQIKKINDTFDAFISYTLFENLKSNSEISAERISIETKQGESKLYGTLQTIEMAQKVHTVIHNLHPKMGWKISIDVKDEMNRKLDQLKAEAERARSELFYLNQKIERLRIRYPNEMFYSYPRYYYRYDYNQDLSRNRYW